MKKILFYTYLAALLSVEANAVQFSVKNIAPGKKITFSLYTYPSSSISKKVVLTLPTTEGRADRSLSLEQYLKDFQKNPGKSKDTPSFGIQAMEIENGAEGHKTYCGQPFLITKDTNLHNIDDDHKVEYDGRKTAPCSLTPPPPPTSK